MCLLDTDLLCQATVDEIMDIPRVLLADIELASVPKKWERRPAVVPKNEAPHAREPWHYRGNVWEGLTRGQTPL